MHRDAGRLRLAEDSYREALGLYGGSKDTAALDLANTLRPYAILREGAGDLEQARALWKEAKDLYATANVNEGVAESSARLARLES